MALTKKQLRIAFPNTYAAAMKGEMDSQIQLKKMKEYTLGTLPFDEPRKRLGLKPIKRRKR